MTITLVPNATALLEHLHANFLTIMPKIERHAKVYFRGVRCPVKKEDFIAETVDKAWEWFGGLARKGKDATRFPCTLARYAACAVRCGRRLCGSEKAKDVMSSVAQQRHGFVVSSLPSSTATSHEHLYSRPHGQQHQDEWEQRLADNFVTPVDDQVAFRLDFKAWLKTLTARERHIVKAMMLSLRTKELSKMFGLSEGRISQLRREFLEDWRRFVGDEAICSRRPLKRRKKKVRA